VRSSDSLLLNVLCAVLVASSISSLGWAQKPDAAQPRNDPASTAPIKPDTTAAVDPKTYVIGAQDVLMIKVWREQDFSGPYPVRPDGKITMPLVGDVQAGGLTPEQLGEQLKQTLSKFINAPDVSVSLQTVNSKKFFITGEVNRAGEYSLATPTKVFDALSNAGGFRDFANKKKIIIIRGSERIKFNYQDILKGKGLEQNIFLENGDTIVVP
jgi:polysaccharide export outer membrane protein